jgi:hypothetical protein
MSLTNPTERRAKPQQRFVDRLLSVGAAWTGLDPSARQRPENQAPRSMPMPATMAWRLSRA